MRPQGVYFVSGHLDLTKEEFEEHYVPKLEDARLRGGHFVVGDAVGADYMAQRWLATNEATYAVYHMLERPRHCFGTGFGSHDDQTRWNARIRDGLVLHGGFRTDEERDAAMTAASSHDIAWVRDDRSKRRSGTAQNLERRVAHERALRLQERSTWERGFIDDLTDDGELALHMPRPDRPFSEWQRKHLVPIPPGFYERYAAAIQAYQRVIHELGRIRAEAEDLKD